MALLQKKLLDAVNMAKNILLLAVALFSIILEITLYFFRGIESLSIYLILVRFFIIYLSVVYFPFFIISLGFIPSIMTNDIIKYKIFLRKYNIYSDPVDIELKDANDLDKLQRNFGINAISVRYAIKIELVEISSRFDIYISPWYYDFQFKTEKACLQAYKRITKNMHPIYFQFFPWIGFCTADISMRGKCVCWTLSLLAITFYFLSL